MCSKVFDLKSVPVWITCQQDWHFQQSNSTRRRINLRARL